MTTSNHVYAGAIIALSIKQPVLAVPLAFLSHITLDALPHYGRNGDGYGEIVKFKLTWLMEAVNIVALPLLVWWLHSQSTWVYVAAIAALSPDFIWIYRYFWYERKGLEPPTDPFTRLHKRVQWCEKPWGIIVEYPFLGLMMLAVWKMIS